MQSKLILNLLVVFLIQSQLHGQAMPNYAAMVGGKESGPIKRGEFLAQQGLGGMRHVAGNHWERIPIDSFSLVIIRDMVVVALFKNKGQAFTTDTKAQLSRLAANDKVLIYDIYGRDYGDTIVFVRPIEFIIE